MILFPRSPERRAARPAFDLARPGTASFIATSVAKRGPAARIGRWSTRGQPRPRAIGRTEQPIRHLCSVALAQDAGDGRIDFSISPAMAFATFDSGIPVFCASRFLLDWRY